MEAYFPRFRFSAHLRLSHDFLVCLVCIGLAPFPEIVATGDVLDFLGSLIPNLTFIVKPVLLGRGTNLKFRYQLMIYLFVVMF